MTTYFNFDELTWPQVADLPRNTPLILPLGAGYPWPLVAQALNSPQRIGLLPAFPFGWPGSGLQVSEDLLAAYVGNLINSLRDDGFSQAYALTPQNVELGLGTSQLRFHSSQQHAALVPDSQKEKVILMPIGHTEQHAHHLPLSTDTLIIDAIAKGTVAQAKRNGYMLPVMPYGVSTHRASFAGTLNAGGRAFEDFWLDVVERLVQRGFTRFYLISGHGGNCSFLVNVVKYAGDWHKRIFCATAWLHTSGSIGVAALEKYRDSKIGGMGHAGELETSMVLALRPDLVHMERVIDDIDFVSTPNYFMDWVEGGALIANPPWDDDSIGGAYGVGSLGSAEKGRLWLDAAIEEKVQHIHEIQEQHKRREERRNAGYGLWGK